MTLNNFHYSMTLMEQLYGITMQEDQFEETGLVAWNLIGNKRYKLYSHVSGVPDIDVSYKEKIGFDLLVLEEVKRIR